MKLRSSGILVRRQLLTSDGWVSDNCWHPRWPEDQSLVQMKSMRWDLPRKLCITHLRIAVSKLDAARALRSKWIPRQDFRPRGPWTRSE